jgi:Uma2 family endonuclease
MTVTPIQRLTLDAFLQLPQVDESPAWEFIDGAMQQKPMPKTRHAMLQKRLLNAVDGQRPTKGHRWCRILP